MDSTNPPRAPRLLQQLIERLRYLHYSLRTEEAYVYWVRQFIRWHGLRHPRDMAAPPDGDGPVLEGNRYGQ